MPNRPRPTKSLEQQLDAIPGYREQVAAMYRVHELDRLTRVTVPHVTIPHDMLGPAQPSPIDQLRHAIRQADRNRLETWDWTPDGPGHHAHPYDRHADLATRTPDNPRHRR